MASPRPKLASTEATFRLPVTGSAVKRMPAACGKTICCTTTAMRTFRRATPLARRAARGGGGRERDAGRLREDHLLHDYGHVDLPVVQAVAQAVGHGPLGEER